ncbi:MAG: hypothetical protein INH34_20345, partial [Phycisphaerales bacterium]|nr:hypothetical protein [Phycisphaerales bacterium]
AAAEMMAADGWWWTSAQLTEKAIKRRVLRETVAVLFGRRPATPPEGEATAPAPVVAPPAAARVEIPRPQLVPAPGPASAR